MLEISRVYNIPTYSPAILGTMYKNVTLKGIVDYESALAISNVELLQRQIYPTLPAGTPDNPRAYTWYHFKTVNNTSVVLAHPWIDMSNVELVVSKVGIITVPNITDADVLRIVNQIRAMGYYATSELRDVIA